LVVVCLLRWIREEQSGPFEFSDGLRRGRAIQKPRFMDLQFHAGRLFEIILVEGEFRIDVGACVANDSVGLPARFFPLPAALRVGRDAA